MNNGAEWKLKSYRHVQNISRMGGVYSIYTQDLRRFEHALYSPPSSQKKKPYFLLALWWCYGAVEEKKLLHCIMFNPLNIIAIYPIL